VLAYLSRYTHRIAISNSRLIRFDAGSVTFKVKNYRINGCVSDLVEILGGVLRALRFGPDQATRSRVIGSIG
jgi:hypothetical protein